MSLNTSSEVISFTKELESGAARFYEDLAQRHPKDEAILLSFAKENKQNIVQIERAYYSVISDAIEGGFAFNIESDEYRFDTTIAENTGYSKSLEKAIQIEEKMVKFYTDAAEQSRSLMADVPRVFTLVARKRANRSAKLRSLLEKED